MDNLHSVTEPHASLTSKTLGDRPEFLPSDSSSTPLTRPCVWDIGLPRTGTKTFCQALTLLGYERVRHNPRFEHLANLEGASDIGCVIFYKYIDYKHPGSKFVLCLRDIDSWLDSAQFICEKYPSTDKEIAILRRMMLYESVTFDRTKFTDAYYRHHDDVRRYFKDRPGDLLEMNITEGDGWEKLCPFLGLPIPTQPFPHKNKRTDFYPDPVSRPTDMQPSL
jgi:hypothetical protein